MTYASNYDNIPKKPHWAIITFSSIHIPGDERSRTSPGHGYPAHTESVIKYQTFTDQDEWEKAVTPLEERNEKYIAGYFTPASIRKVIHIEGMPSRPKLGPTEEWLD